MRKRRRQNQYQQDQASQRVNPAEPAEPSEEYSAEDAASDADVEALTADTAVSAVEGVPGSEEGLSLEPAANSAVSAANSAAEPVDEFSMEALAEPMDELLAELLAQDTDFAAVMEAASEMPAAADAVLLASETEPDLTPEMEPEFELAALEVAAGIPEPVAEPIAAPRAPGSEAGVFQLQAEEPEVPVTSAASQELLPEVTADEPPPPALEVKHEPAVEALAPQPPLEHVVSSIDSALEQTRAINVAAEPAPQASHHKQFSQLDDYVVFSLSGSDYAVPVRDVAEIGRVPAITRVPNIPDFVRGITNLRGEVVPVLNLPALLGLQDVPLSARGRVLFLQGRDRISATGLLVDEVKGIQRIQSQQLEQVTGLVDDKVTSVLRGVHGRGDRLLNVLDLEQLFQLQEFRQLQTR